MATIQTKIALRRDDLSNWNTTSSQVLHAGEIAIVVDANGNENLKIGNGLSSFGQLPYIYANSLTTKQFAATSISQGQLVKSSPTSLAAGIHLEADGNYNVVNGIQAHAKNGDDYAYVFNGDNVSPSLSTLTARYESHGKGTFNINPLSGANGFYIGEKSLSSLMSESSTKIKAGAYGTDLSSLESLSVVKIAAEDYYQLVANDQTREDVLYIVSSDTLNAYDSRVENVALPTAGTDAANKQYVDSSVNDATAKIPLSVSQLKNDMFLELSCANDQRIWIKDGNSIKITGAEASSTASITLIAAGFMQLSGRDGGIELTGGSFIDVNNVSGRVEINDGAYIGMTQGFEQICAYIKTATATPPSGISATNLVQFIDSKVAPAQQSADKKIFIDDLSTETLSIQHIAADDYYKIVASNPEQLLSNKMYIVSSDYINAYGGRVRNVADPEADDDAVTKKYSDQISANLALRITDLEQTIGTLNDELEAIV